MADDRRMIERVEALIGRGSGEGRLRLVVQTVLLATILLAVGAAMIDTLPDLDADQRRWIDGALWTGAAVFFLEYLARLYAAPAATPGLDAAVARGRYLLSSAGIVDLIVLAPLLPRLGLPVDAGWVDLIGLLALLKLGRFSQGLTLLGTVFRNERRPLLAAVLTMLVLLTLAAGIMYLLEREAQPEIFSSIPRTLWWAIVTMASVGYGDMVPVTPLGRLFGGAVMLLGIAMFAVPAGILATGYAAEMRRRDFVVTWQAVQRVPLFAGLDATRIAGITRLLKTQIVPVDHVIVKRGDTADAMFFIMKGAVAVDVSPHPVRLGAGQFFGEIALLKDTLRSATVTAAEECQLLVLEVSDFRRLMDQLPDLKAKLEEVAAERLQATQGR